MHGTKRLQNMMKEHYLRNSPFAKKNETNNTKKIKKENIGVEITV